MFHSSRSKQQLTSCADIGLYCILHLACALTCIIALPRFSAKASIARADCLEAYFTCLRDKQPVVIKATSVDGGIKVTHARC